MQKIILPLITVFISTLLLGMDGEGESNTEEKIGDCKTMRGSKSVYEVTKTGKTVKLVKYPKKRNPEEDSVSFGKLLKPDKNLKGKKKDLTDLRTGKDLSLQLMDLLKVKVGNNIRDVLGNTWSVLNIRNLSIVFTPVEVTAKTLKKNQSRYSGIICEEGSEGKVRMFTDIVNANKFYITNIKQIKRKKDTSKKKNESQ